MKPILATAAALSIAVSGCSSRPERLTVQHPSAADVADPACIGAEPSALTDAELDGPNADTLEGRFNAAMVNWGRTCEAALSRVCQWHVDLGLALPDGLRCEAVIRAPAEEAAGERGL